MGATKKRNKNKKIFFACNIVDINGVERGIKPI